MIDSYYLYQDNSIIYIYKDNSRGFYYIYKDMRNFVKTIQSDRIKLYKIYKDKISDILTHFDT